jgi:hypothetical protein
LEETKEPITQIPEKRKREEDDGKRKVVIDLEGDAIPLD